LGYSSADWRCGRAVDLQYALARYLGVADQDVDIVAI